MNAGSRSFWLILAAFALTELAPTARTATLDATASGTDITFTWDTAGPDTLLRGVTADALTPWLVNVSSPLLVAGENAPRGEHAFYRLASGSNMAFRLERTYDETDPLRASTRFVTLPERRVARTPADLFAMWPSLVEVVWSSVPDFWRTASRFSFGIVSMPGDLPPQGAVGLAFSSPTTITLVGSDDPATTGQDVSEPGVFLAIPPHSRRMSLATIACGDEGVDWVDADGNTLPDTCGQDLDFDGDQDTSLWRGAILDCGMSLQTQQGTLFGVRNTMFSGTDTLGAEQGIEPGDCLYMGLFPSSNVAGVANLPAVLPTW